MNKKKIAQQRRNKQLYNKIYQFNKKIDKLQNDDLISPYLPNKINYNDYKNMDGRSQRAFINSLTNFTKRGGEKLTENIITYHMEDNDTLDGLIELHNLVYAWSLYMSDLYFICGQTNKNLGDFNT